MRGLAASARIQGQYKSAIQHLERVLEISQEFKEFTGAACSCLPCPLTRLFCVTAHVIRAAHCLPV